MVLIKTEILIRLENVIRFGHETECTVYVIERMGNVVLLKKCSKNQFKDHLVEGNWRNNGICVVLVWVSYYFNNLETSL